MRIYRDIKFVLRIFVKHPGSSLLGIAVLGVGLGMSLTIFALTSGVLFSSPDIQDGQDFVRIDWFNSQSSIGFESRLNASEYQLLRNNQKSFKWITGYRKSRTALNNPRSNVVTERYKLANVFDNFFNHIALKPVLGRTLTAEDWVPKAKRVVVLSYTVWQDHFMGLRDAIGQRVMLNGAAHTVVGVMPKGQGFPADAHLWIPMNMFPRNHEVRNRIAFGVLDNNVTISQAEREFSAILSPLAEQHPEINKYRTRIKISSYNLGFIPGVTQNIFKVLSAGALLVFIVACANISNLLMVRISKRQNELAIRNMLGASRYQMIEQIMLEGLLFSITGIIAGYIIYALAAEAVWLNIERGFFTVPYWWGISLDWKVNVFAIAAAFTSAIASSFVPAMRVLNVREKPILRSDIRTTSGLTIGKMSKLFIAIQVVCSTALLVTALMTTLLIRFVTDWGLSFDTKKILTTNVLLNSRAGFKLDTKTIEFYSSVARDIRRLPRVEGVGFSFHEGGVSQLARQFQIRGKAKPQQGNGLTAGANIVSQGFFELFDMQPIFGRLFLASDTEKSEKVVIVNQHFADAWFKNKNPLDNYVKVHRPGMKTDALARNKPWTDWMRIVGVVPNIQRRLLPGEQAADLGEMYIPVRQRTSRWLWLLVKTNGNVGDLIAPIRQILHKHAPLLAPVSPVRTVHARFDDLNSGLNTLVGIVTVFGIVTLLMTVAGLYGLISFVTIQQRREFGIRSAIGAGSCKVIWLVLQRILWQLLFGLMLGGVISIFFSNAIRQQLSMMNVPLSSSWYFIGFSIVAVACLIAATLPAFNATKVPPNEALRVS